MPKPRHYRYKIDQGPEPEVQFQDRDMSKTYPVGQMLIASPKWVEEYLQQIPEGEVRTIEQLRQALAARAGADYTCPLTTGIFARIVAEASYYEEQNGLPIQAPWWRLVKNDGSMNDKFPGGGSVQADHLTKEGVLLTQTGRSKKLKVALS